MVSGAEMVAKYLEEEGVEYVFGLCGHTTLALLDALAYKTKIKFITCRHEQIAAHAADGYFRVTHKPGIVLVHVEPGMTNAVTGVANAALGFFRHGGHCRRCSKFSLRSRPASGDQITL